MQRSNFSPSFGRQLVGLAGWLLLTFAAAAIGALAAAQAGMFYQQLARPTWAPPAWLFAPVLAEIALLWVLIVATVITFWRLQLLAAVLLLPYLVWVSFACALTYSTWKLNPGLLG